MPEQPVLSGELALRLIQFAELEGKLPSDVAVELIEEGLAAREAALAARIARAVEPPKDSFD